MQGDSKLDVLRSVMGISDLEVCVRDLDGLLFDRFGEPRPDAKMLANRFVSLIAKIARHSNRNEGYPLLLMEEWVLDFVLIPLLWCFTLSATRARAKRVYESICDLMESKSGLKHEVPIYREALTTVTDFKSKDEVGMLFARGMLSEPTDWSELT